MKLIKIFKREILKNLDSIYSYFKNKFFLTSIFFNYYRHMKVYNIVKTLDISSLKYSHTIDEGGFSSKKNHYFIINNKYVISNYKWSIGGSAIRIYISEGKYIYIEDALKWLEETEFIDSFLNTINTMKYQEKIFKEGDIIPSIVSLKRVDTINKLLSKK